jgi:hypothetical protein
MIQEEKTKPEAYGKHEICKHLQLSFPMSDQNDKSYGSKCCGPFFSWSVSLIISSFDRSGWISFPVTKHMKRLLSPYDRIFTSRDICDKNMVVTIHSLDT